jgi:hypothetical protein
MKRTMVTYKVRPEAAAVNEELIRGVFGELAQAEPQNVRYTAFVLGDGVTFVHIVEIEDGENPIPQLGSFKRYTEAVLERCEDQPVVTEPRVVGTYRFGDG